MNSKLNITVVIPVYNSATMLEELTQRIDAALKSYSYHIILVDDGSKDASWVKLEEIKKNFQSKITIIKLARNFGQHNAVICGFSYSKGDVVVTMDDDLQHPPEEIIKLIQKYEETGADVVYGEYINQSQDMIKTAGSYIFKKGSKFVNDSPGRGSSFRLIKTDIIEKMVENHKHNFYFIDEIIQWYTAHVEFITVEHNKRKEGKSGYGKMKLLKMFLNITVNYSSVPLTIMTYGGIIGSIITFIIGIYFIAKKIFFQVEVPGFTAIIVAILFTASIMLLCFGIVGQYLYRIMQFQNRKPPFQVKKIM
jgi:glycosyltransferase involved in cell wall biosynthesis